MTATISPAGRSCVRGQGVNLKDDTQVIPTAQVGRGAEIAAGNDNAMSEPRPATHPPMPSPEIPHVQ
jgi:hypothetical protein